MVFTDPFCHLGKALSVFEVGYPSFVSVTQLCHLRFHRWIGFLAMDCGGRCSWSTTINDWDSNAEDIWSYLFGLVEIGSVSAPPICFHYSSVSATASCPYYRQLLRLSFMGNAIYFLEVSFDFLEYFPFEFSDCCNCCTCSWVRD